MIEPLFFRGPEGASLSGVWRLPESTPARVWVVCPPFAEEEKSAHRTLVELADALVAGGDAVFFFAYRGTGDSDDDFAETSLADWRADIEAALAFAGLRFPASAAGLIGLRLGASLAAQVATASIVQSLVLIEPVLRGKSFLMQLGARKKLRAAMTEEEAGSQGLEAGGAARENEQTAYEDLDGWPLGQQLRDELNTLNLSTAPPQFSGTALVLQVAPREKIAPPLEQFATALNPQTTMQAVVLPAFWNRLDHIDSSPLIEAITNVNFPTSENIAGQEEFTQPPASNPQPRLQALTLDSSNQTLVATWHGSLQPPASSLVLLHGWTGYRTGPHQMLTRAARRLAGQTRTALRFDFAGRGDSEGDADLSTLATMAQDARAAIRYARSQNPQTPIFLIGLCSGCEIAFAVADEPGVAGLVLWSAPVFAAGQSEERVARKRSKHLKEYARKLLRPATWSKVISGRLDVKGIRKVVGQGGGEEFKNAETGQAGHLPPGWRSDAIGRFENVRVPSLLVYGTADPTTPEALAWYRGQLRVAPQVHLVEGANHSYYGLNWEEEVLRTTESWLLTLEGVDKE